MSNTPAKMDETSAAVALPDDLGDLIPTMDDLGVSSGMLASLTPTFKVPSATVAAAFSTAFSRARFSRCAT